MVIVGDRTGTNPRHFTLTDGKFQVQVEVWDMDGEECVIFKQMCPLKLLKEWVEYLETL